MISSELNGNQYGFVCNGGNLVCTFFFNVLNFKNSFMFVPGSNYDKTRKQTLHLNFTVLPEVIRFRLPARVTLVLHGSSSPAVYLLKQIILHVIYYYIVQEAAATSGHSE